jgi:hypothetical protein
MWISGSEGLHRIISASVRDMLDVGRKAMAMTGAQLRAKIRPALAQGLGSAPPYPHLPLGS